MENSLAALIIGSEKISTLPPVYSRLMEVMSDHRSSVTDISAIISQDAGMSVRLLRIVNSAFFGFPRKIDTVSRAVQIVGVEQVRDLVLATSVMNSFETVPDNIVTMESFWMHSVGCGVAARVIASFCKESNIERFFVAGILHDIGRLIIYDRLPEKTMEIMNYAEQTGELMYRAERAILGFDHAAVGSALINTWRLPPSLEEIIADHHKPTVANLYRRDTTIVHFADVITHAMKLGNSGELHVPNINEDAWKYLELSLDVLPQLFDTVDKQANDIFRKFLSEK
jgi:HD-like signal output (HDOD) protein